MKSDNHSNNHFYDGWIYRTFIDPSLAGIRRRIVALVPEGSTVIDVGSGSGDQLLYLAPHIKTGVGVELSQSMINTSLQQASKHGITNCHFLYADALDLSQFTDQSYDIAMGSLVIHEMPEEKRIPVLSEMKRLGKTVILVDWIHPQTSIWKKFSTHLIERLAGKEHYSGFCSFIKAGGIPGLLEKVGFDVLDTQITGKGTIQLWVCKP